MPKLFNLKLGFLGKIGAREKGWIVAWVFVVLGFLSYRFVVQPKALSLRETSTQVEALEKQKISLLAKKPDVKKRQEKIEEIKREIAQGYEQLTAAEENLLDVQDVDRFLDALVKERKKFEFILNSVRPLQQKAGSAEGAAAASDADKRKPQMELYRSLSVQIDLYGTFQGFLDYVGFLEQMGPYQEVQGIKVKVEGKEISRPHAVLLVSALMGQTDREKASAREEIFALVGEVTAREAKDPFLTQERPKEVVLAVGLELNGVFAENGHPVSAMINNEIYRVGQVIQGKRIIAIEPNRVILEQGNRRFVLVPSQQKGGGE